MSSAIEQPPRGPHRRWYQFGLRAILIATAVIALVVLWQRPRLERWIEALRASPPSPPPVLRVTIDADGSLAFAGHRGSSEDLRRWLAGELEERQHAGHKELPPVIITAHGHIPVAPLVDTIRSIEQVGLFEIHVRWAAR